MVDIRHYVQWSAEEIYRRDPIAFLLMCSILLLGGACVLYFWVIRLKKRNDAKHSIHENEISEVKTDFKNFRTEVADSFKEANHATSELAKSVNNLVTGVREMGARMEERSRAIDGSINEVRKDVRELRGHVLQIGK